MIADAPMRATMRCARGHTALDGCDYCTLKAITIKVSGSITAAKPKGTSRMAWFWDAPLGDPEKVLKTHAEAVLLQERLQAGEKLDKDESRGYTGRSPLLDLENFDIIRVR